MTSISSAENAFRVACALLGYDWLYIPACNWLHVTPWTPTGYAMAMLALAGACLLARQVTTVRP
jgi:hypothetical protein